MAVSCFAHFFLLPMIFSANTETPQYLREHHLLCPGGRSRTTMKTEDAEETAKVIPTILAPFQQTKGLGLSSPQIT